MRLGLDNRKQMRIDKAKSVVAFLCNYASMQISYSDPVLLRSHNAIFASRPLTSLALTPQSVPLLSHIVSSFSSELESLTLSLPHSGPVLSPEVVQKLPLRRLSLVSTQLPQGFPYRALAELTELVMCNVVFSSPVNKELSALGTFVATSVALATFSLTRCDLTEAAVESFAHSAAVSEKKENRTLVSLVLGEFATTHLAATELGEFFAHCKALRSFIMTRISLTIEGLYCLAKGLGRLRLDALGMRGFTLVDPGQGRYEAAVAECFVGLDCLESLLFSKIMMGSDFYLNLRLPGGLRKLSLAAKSLSDPVASQLVLNCRDSCKRLRELRLAAEKIGERTCVALLELMAAAPSLDTLALQVIDAPMPRLEDLLRAMLCSREMRLIKLDFCLRKRDNILGVQSLAKKLVLKIMRRRNVSGGDIVSLASK